MSRVAKSRVSSSCPGSLASAVELLAKAAEQGARRRSAVDAGAGAKPRRAAKAAHLDSSRVWLVPGTTPPKLGGFAAKRATTAAAAAFLSSSLRWKSSAADGADDADEAKPGPSPVVAGAETAAGGGYGADEAALGASWGTNAWAVGSRVAGGGFGL